MAERKLALVGVALDLYFEVSLELKNVNILASRSAWISRKMQEASSYARILSFLVTSVHDRTKGRLVSPIVPTDYQDGYATLVDGLSKHLEAAYLSGYFGIALGLVVFLRSALTMLVVPIC